MSRQPDLREQLTDAIETLERIGMDAMAPATVLDISAKTIKVATGSDHLIIAKDRAASFKIGDNILIHNQQKAYIRHNEFKGRGERLYVIQDVLNERAVIDVNGEKRTVMLAVEEVQIGDKVLLDPSLSVILEVLPRNKKEFTAVETGVHWDDIGGCRRAKEALIEAIEHPIHFAEMFTHYGASPSGGIVLYGPPGCGKTMLAKAAATAMGAIDGFLHCKGPEVLDPYVGVAEATIRGLFSRAREFHQKTGRRAVIFIDEAEAILGSRGQRYAMMEKTIVPTFLSEMDGMDESPATVILATNRPEDLDSAVVRDGRMDRRVEVHRPDQADSVEIAIAHLKKAPTQSEDKQDMAEKIVDEAFMATFTNRGEVKVLHRYMSGALLAGIVGKAKTFAMQRDIREGTITGITQENLSEGLALTLNEMGAIALDEAA